MNELQISLAAAKNRRRDALKALDDVKQKQFKAAKVFSLLESEKETLAGVQAEVDNYRLDAMERGADPVFLPKSLMARLAAKNRVDQTIAAAQIREDNLKAERAVVEAAVADAEEAIRREAGAVLAAEQADVWKRAEGLWTDYIEAVREVIALGSVGYGRINVAERINHLTPLASRDLNGQGIGKTNARKEAARERYADLIAPVGEVSHNDK